jgi:hypothetical protein
MGNQRTVATRRENTHDVGSYSDRRVTCDERFAHLVGWDANCCVRLAWGDLAPWTGCIELLLIQDPPNSSASHSTNRVPVSTAICPNVKAMSTRNVERLISPPQLRLATGKQKFALQFDQN